MPRCVADLQQVKNIGTFYHIYIMSRAVGCRNSDIFWIEKYKDFTSLNVSKYVPIKESRAML